jgi:hypothetical protein
MKKLRSSKYNIFQSNKLLNRTIADALGYDVPEDKIQYGWFTEDMFLTTFFYLSKRFGQPTFFDDCKEAGAWHFKVKDYEVSVHLNSNWVSFIMYGDGKKFPRIPQSPYITRYRRESKKKRRRLINMFSQKKTKLENEIIEKLWNVWSNENLDESWTSEKWDASFEMREKWFSYTNAYNDTIINIGTWREWQEKHGEIKINSHVRHAKRTMAQFLKNMLTPIYIRDVPYNIKGKLRDNEAFEYGNRYGSNIEIIYTKK